MDFILGIALLTAVGFIAYHVGKEAGYGEAISQKHASRYCHG